jgi:predicted lipoprotein with Yx(FWY)xxD motif
MTSFVHTYRHRAIALPILGIAGASLLFAACGSSSKPTTSPATTAAAASGSATTAAGSGSSNSSVTVSVASVPKLGRVLVNGAGQTLYILASEHGGKITCTTANGCTAIWPAAVLPSGMMHGIAGSGVQASMLGTVMGPSGDTRLTYAGWPLYTYTIDHGPGQTTGQGVKDTWGTWWVLSPSGSPIMTAVSSPATTAPASSPATSPATAPASGGGAPASGGAGF